MPYPELLKPVCAFEAAPRLLALDEALLAFALLEPVWDAGLAPVAEDDVDAGDEDADEDDDDDDDDVDVDVEAVDVVAVVGLATAGASAENRDGAATTFSVARVEIVGAGAATSVLVGATLADRAVTPLPAASPSALMT